MTADLQASGHEPSAVSRCWAPYLRYKVLAVIFQKWQLARRHFLWRLLFVRIARILYVTIKVFLMTSDFAGDAMALPAFLAVIGDGADRCWLKICRSAVPGA
jgi:hypothetical protein